MNRTKKKEENIQKKKYKQKMLKNKIVEFTRSQRGTRLVVSIKCIKFVTKKKCKQE